MKIPTDASKIHDHALAVFWIDENGILHKISKNTPRTIENVKDLYSFIRKATQEKKVRGLVEVSNETASNKKVREVLKEEIPMTFNAVALLTTTPSGKMMATIISVLIPGHLPTKLFTDEDKAILWLKALSD